MSHSTNPGGRASRTGRLLREDGSFVNEAAILLHNPLDIARGQFTGASSISAFGELTTSGAVTNHLVWPVAGSGNLVVPDSAGVQMTVVSDHAQDDAAGTGLRTVNIIYLDGDLNQQNETVIMDGVTPVTTTATDIRFVNCVHVLTAGTGLRAAGNISVTHGGNTYSYIAAGHRRCRSSARRVPAGKRLIIDLIYASAISGTASSEAIVRLVTTGINGSDFTEDAITIPQMGIGQQDGADSLSGFIFTVPAGQVVGFETECSKASTITAGFIGWLEPAT